MALYGKYRPKTFADMVGQDSTKQTLLAISQHNKFSHAYLFCGTRGTGKTTSARILAKAINCENKMENGDPCGKCDCCVMAEENKMTDIIEIDAASNRGIDEVRSLIEKVAFQPNFGKAKIYIIDEVHMMTKEAFNALLKTLEEPPSHAFFILATTEFHKVPETIRSRCQTYFFRNIPLEVMKDRLAFICDQENIEYTDEGLDIIAQRANGGLRDAISLLEQSSSYGSITKENLSESLGIISPQTLEHFYTALLEKDTAQSLQILKSLQNEGRSLEEFGKDFLWYIREQLHAAIFQKKPTIVWLLATADIFQKALQKSKQFPFPSLAFEMAIAESFIENNNTSAPKITPQTNADITPQKKSLPTDNSPKVSADPSDKKESENPTPIEKNIIAPWEDDLMPQNTTFFESKKNEENPKIEQTPAAVEMKKNEWEEMLEILPKTLRMNIVQYGEITKIDDSTLQISISGPTVKALIEKNKGKIEEACQAFYKIPMKVMIVEPEEKNTNSLSPKDLESMFQF